MREKSPYGQPCNQCGRCCQEALCPIAMVIFGHEEEGPCPALGFDSDGASFCGMVRSPRKFAPVKTAIHGAQAMIDAALWIIAAGYGCDAQAEGEPDNPIARARMRSETDAYSFRTFQALHIWGFV